MVLISYVRPLLTIHSNELLKGKLTICDNSGRVIKTYNVSSSDYFYSVKFNIKKGSVITALFQSSNSNTQKKFVIDA